MTIHVVSNDSAIQSQIPIDAGEFGLFDDEIVALNAAEALCPRIIFLDYGLRAEKTPSFIELLITASPTSRLIIVTNNQSDDQILACLLAGAKGYQDVSQLPFFADKLIQAIDNDEAWISRQMVAKLIDAIRSQTLTVTSGLSLLAADFEHAYLNDDIRALRS